VAALVVGRLYDRWPRRSATLLALVVAIGVGYPFFALATRPAAVMVGVALWSLVAATVDAIAKAGIAERVAPGARGGAYGLYYAVFGVAWWLGSLTLGVAYDAEPELAMAVAAVAMAASAVVLAVSGRTTGSPAAPGLP
jgi:predicted MFS family arabinose efflux permease